MTDRSLVQLAGDVAGADAVREPTTPADAIDGVIPRLVVEPATSEQVAATLGWASRDRLSVVIRGAGTKDEWGRPPAPIDIALGTKRLQPVLKHDPGDLVVTLSAGMTLAATNVALAQHRQWLAMDPPDAAQATIGGIIASNDSGPLRHRYGTPRDLIIGVQLAMADGRLVKAGGRVVKNVAGYDLSKLICGSFGSLAAIVGATFKLAPTPTASRTVVCTFEDTRVLAQFVQSVAMSQLEPIAFDLTAERAGAADPSWTLSTFLRFASLGTSDDREIALATDLARSVSAPARVVDDAAGSEHWQAVEPATPSRDGVLVRAAWLPAKLADALDAIRAACDGVHVRVRARAGLGAGLIQLDAEPDALVAAVERIRKSTSLGHVVLVKSSIEFRRRVDAWGAHGDVGPLLQRIKQSLDPQQILGGHRGPL